MITCVGCNVQFVPRLSNSRYCTKACYQHQWWVAKYGRALAVKDCAHCGKAFTCDKYHPARMCCSRRCTAKEWYALNKVTINQAKREWAKANPSKVKASQRKSRAKNPDKWRTVSRLKENKRRARLKAAIIEPFTTHDWDVLVSSQGGRCWWCGGVGLKLELDHVLAIANGGNHTKDNFVASCKRCNCSKGAKIRSITISPIAYERGWTCQN